MFAINTNAGPLYDFNSFANFFNEYQRYQQQQQEQQRQQQLAQSRPKIIKKLETEDKYQIQIFKRYGNFDSYEVRVLKSSSFNFNNLINLVIESREDEFRKAFQFNLEDIEVGEIDWEYFENDNVLVLNIPKKIKYCTDDLTDALGSILFGYDPRTSFSTQRQLKQQEAERAEQEIKRAAEEKAKRVAEEKARREAELKARREAELKARREADLKARKEAELKARQEAELKARQEAEEKARREAEQQARREAQEKARQEAEKARQTRQEAEKKAEQAAPREEEYARAIRQQQEFISQLFGAHPLFQQLSPFFEQAIPKAEPNSNVESNSTPSKNEKPEVTKVDSGNQEETIKPTSYESDEESISSEPETEASTPETKPNVKVLKSAEKDSSLSPLHKHPSIEEVEDEEFVMFRKKFGQ
ncbi:hypothetical protein HYPBUDRAFT_149737 [Hyphopichia burtonii NRRL Y-1933]|uniref:Uncharacterized protein n=1 Tax=Hyphopichia burtonii NRRL Y-1933 TaxID=984485 RepID=A0A1E4RFA8_9ASCO|nr:hypothetical protein HYPBUDRAFT_149737 [Hyphopichia burtonii NRRL Y-1933]ODV65952.1 hypothetical protein HYPBUDRAFT_149737 [Hyphopichia burtonii NRRL Y-1933]